MAADESTFEYDVFLSHSSKDKAVVRELATRLRKDGLEVWLDEWVIQPGDSIPSLISEGLTQSRILVLCMSANAFGSDWVTLEHQTVMFRDPMNKNRRFVPIRIDGSPIKDILRQFAYVDWQQKDDQNYQKLLKACQPKVSETRIEEGDRTAASSLQDDGIEEEGDTPKSTGSEKGAMIGDRQDATDELVQTNQLVAGFKIRA